MTRRRVVPVAAAALAATVLAVVGVLVFAPASTGAPAPGRAPLGPGVVTVRLDVHHSRFARRVVRVRPHTEVRFVVVNHDPINHELIVGAAEVHDRHEHGTEPAHDPRPGEVSVAPDARASTTFWFHEEGTVLYACHLPGHLAYGMHGQVVVVPA